MFAYDIASGEQGLWADAVAGTLTGATDTYLLTEERVHESNRDAVRLIIRSYDREGRSRKLAEFAADGLAGQSQVLGDRAVWVKPHRHLVTARLAGVERTGPAT